MSPTEIVVRSVPAGYAPAAGHVGAPVVLLSGDDTACNELHNSVPKATTVPVKQAVGQSAAITLHPAKAPDRLRHAAAEATTNRREVRPFQIRPAAGFSPPRATRLRVPTIVF